MDRYLVSAFMLIFYRVIRHRNHGHSSPVCPCAMYCKCTATAKPCLCRRCAASTVFVGTAAYRPLSPFPRRTLLREPRHSSDAASRFASNNMVTVLGSRDRRPRIIRRYTYCHWNSVDKLLGYVKFVVPLPSIIKSSGTGNY